MEWTPRHPRSEGAEKAFAVLRSAVSNPRRIRRRPAGGAPRDRRDDPDRAIAGRGWWWCVVPRREHLIDARSSEIDGSCLQLVPLILPRVVKVTRSFGAGMRPGILNQVLVINDTARQLKRIFPQSGQCSTDISFG